MYISSSDGIFFLLTISGFDFFRPQTAVPQPDFLNWKLRPNWNVGIMDYWENGL